MPLDYVASGSAAESDRDPLADRRGVGKAGERIRQGGRGAEEVAGQIGRLALWGDARRATTEPAKEDMAMMSMALTFLIVGLVAGLLGLYGVAAVATRIRVGCCSWWEWCCSWFIWPGRGGCRPAV